MAPRQVNDRSRAVLRVGPGPSIEEMRSTGAVAFRPTAWGVWMVGAAAHPIGGDRLLLRLAVRSHCRLQVRSVGATVARRGAGPSVSAAAVRIGDGSFLDWDPEPGVAASGSNHITETRVRMGAGACLRWREEFVLGRYGEDPGTWTSRMRVSIEGRVALCSELSAGPDSPSWNSSATLAGARAVSTLLLFDPDPSRLPPGGRFDGPDAMAVALPLPGSGVQVTAWGDELGACRWAVERLSCQLRGHPTGSGRDSLLPS